MKVFFIIFFQLCFILLNINNQNLEAKNNKKIIYIYNDDGVSKESFTQTKINLFNLGLNKKFQIEKINANQIINGQLSRNVKLLIIPGGASLPYSKKLNGIGNKKIKEFVQKGGSFLGICAGSYYGASFVEFDKNGPLEVLSKKELEFFPGKSIGPALAKYDYKTNSGARAGLIRLSNDKEGFIYFNGGGYFEDSSEKYKKIKILGIYKKINKPAILYRKYGFGKVILSMVHFEYNPYFLDQNDKFLQNIIPELKKNEEFRLELNKIILKKLLNC